MAMYLAGNATTKISACWILSELVRHPEVMAKLVTEVDEIWCSGEAITRFLYLEIHPYIYISQCVTFIKSPLIMNLLYLLYTHGIILANFDLKNITCGPNSPSIAAVIRSLLKLLQIL